ncbi:MAG: hypothetical protein ABIH23_12340 [bacterium]
MQSIQIIKAWWGRLLLVVAGLPTSAERDMREALISPLQELHVYSSCIVECPNGDLLASWFRGAESCRRDDSR